MVERPDSVDRQDGDARVAFSGDLEELVERLGARTRAEAEMVGRAGILEWCGEVLGQGASDKAAKDVDPNYQGTQSAGRFPECDDAPKPCGCQDRRRHGGVGEPEGGLMEQGSSKIKRRCSFVMPDGPAGEPRRAVRKLASSSVSGRGHGSAGR